MFAKNELHEVHDIKFKVVYSSRRTLAISVLPDSSVIVRVPHRTADKTIRRIVQEKSSWIIKHRDTYKSQGAGKQAKMFVNGEEHLFRGCQSILKIEQSEKSTCRFFYGTIELRLAKTTDPVAVKSLLYKGYKDEAALVFPELLNEALKKHSDHMFKPSALVIRTMKRRWGSCSSRGRITLNTELIKLPDLYIEYVITHELCHLKHHNHGTGYYKLLSELFPEWKRVRKELRSASH